VADEEQRVEDPAIHVARQERGERLQRALDQWSAIQSQEEKAAVWAEEHAAQVEQAATELQDAFIDAAIAWLGEKWGPEPTCPFCRNKSWAVGTSVDIALASGATLSPHFTVMCDNCGNTVFINAILAGLLPQPDVDDE
jgi:hypothetical protein